MTQLTWDKSGERFYETGVDRGVLYIPDSQGAYVSGYAWNGLTTVTESPSGAESNPQYADNIKYLNLISAEEFGGTIEAFTYPDEFGQCDGTAAPTPGVLVGQQSRKTFGLSYRTKLGNDLDGQDHGYKLHLVYGALAAPSEKAYATVNDSPEAITFSWEFTTTPVEVGQIAGVDYKPTATLTIDSTKVDAGALDTLEEFLYGTEGTDPSLPDPATVIAMFSGTVLEATPTEPSYDAATDTITIPTVTGVNYYIGGELQAPGPVIISEDTIVEARPAKGYKFPANVDNDWLITYS
ncbi:major tail protein [Streptomyces phage GirlPower]|nr:major tail protein [Streptomyces phage GirlPower]